MIVLVLCSMTYVTSWPIADIYRINRPSLKPNIGPNAANPLVDSAPVSRLAKLADHDHAV